MWRWVVDKRRFSIEGRKDIYTKGWGVKSRDNLVILWYIGSRTWREVKDNEIGYKELLVAGSNKRYRKICGGVQYVSEDKE